MNLVRRRPANKIFTGRSFLVANFFSQINSFSVSQLVPLEQKEQSGGVFIYPFRIERTKGNGILLLFMELVCL
ncbi:MAG TPA: hypothetical protein DCX03_11260 [Bacteroidales bacterium]|nr:hypothetical protein [Bacteroidales bacterium]